jgi:hypothetical protein
MPKKNLQEVFKIFLSMLINNVAYYWKFLRISKGSTKYGNFSRFEHFDIVSIVLSRKCLPYYVTLYFVTFFSPFTDCWGQLRNLIQILHHISLKKKREKKGKWRLWKPFCTPNSDVFVFWNKKRLSTASAYVGFCIYFQGKLKLHYITSNHCILNSFLSLTCFMFVISLFVYVCLYFCM